MFMTRGKILNNRDLLITKIETHNPHRIGDSHALNASALIPLIKDADNSIHILFQVRSSKLPEQPGDICFPGGMAEPGELPAQTAIRETAEELLVDPATIEIIGPSDYLQSGKLFVHPFVGWLNDYAGTYSKDEVKEVFTVPLQWFLENEPERHTMEWKPVFQDDFPFDKIVGGKNYAWRERKEEVLFYEYEEHVIWGMTAKMLEAFIKIVQLDFQHSVDSGQHTLDDYYRLPSERRVELIDGTFFEMEAPNSLHQEIISILQYHFTDYVRKNKGTCKVYGSPIDVQLDQDDRTMVQPDLLVVCNRDKISRFGIYGAPDFCLEVVSPSSGKKDVFLKNYKYANAGVREYWIILPKEKKLLVYNYEKDTLTPEIYSLHGTKGVGIWDNQLEIDLSEIAEAILEFEKL